MTETFIQLIEKIDILLKKDLNYYNFKNQKTIDSFKLIQKTPNHIIYSYKNFSKTSLNSLSYRKNLDSFLKQSDFSNQTNFNYFQFQFFSKTSIKSFINLIYSENPQEKERILLLSSIYHSSFFSKNNYVDFQKLFQFLFENTQEKYQQNLFCDFLTLFTEKYQNIFKIQNLSYPSLLILFRNIEKRNLSSYSRFPSNKLLVIVDKSNIQLFQNFFNLLLQKKENYLQQKFIQNLSYDENIFHHFIQSILPENDWLNFNLENHSLNNKSSQLFEKSFALFYPFEINIHIMKQNFPRIQFQSQSILTTVFNIFKEKKIFHFFNIIDYYQQNNQIYSNIFLLKFHKDKPIILKDFEFFLNSTLNIINHTFEPNKFELIQESIDYSLKCFFIEKNKQNLEFQLLDKKPLIKNKL